MREMTEEVGWCTERILKRHPGSGALADRPLASAATALECTRNCL